MLWRFCSLRRGRTDVYGGIERKASEKMKFTANAKRYDTDKMIEIWTGRRETGTVYFLTGVWLTKRSNHVFVATDSIWDNGNGGTCGTSIAQADMDEIAYLAAELDDDRLYALLPDDSE
jgi:hypothetical protein